MPEQTVPSLIAQTERPTHYTYLKEFRVEPCPLFKQHQCTQHRPFTCFYWHFANQRRRRPVRRKDGTFNYSPDIYCSKYDENTGVCPEGDDCPYLHRVSGDVERKYHLRYYKTCLCVHGTDTKGSCVKNGPHCAFAHGPNDLRPPVHDIREVQLQGSDVLLSGDLLCDNTRTSFVVEEPVWQDTIFVLANYKTEQCKKPPRLCRQGYACPYYHNSKDKRRAPKSFKYRSTPCPAAKNGDDWVDPDNCDGGDNCGYCHTRTEQQFHPEIYKSTRCNDMLQHGYCPRGPFCAFAHTDGELGGVRETAIRNSNNLSSMIVASHQAGRTHRESGDTTESCSISEPSQNSPLGIQGLSPQPTDEDLSVLLEAEGEPPPLPRPRGSFGSHISPKGHHGHKVSSGAIQITSAGGEYQGIMRSHSVSSGYSSGQSAGTLGSHPGVPMVPPCSPTTGAQMVCPSGMASYSSVLKFRHPSGKQPNVQTVGSAPSKSCPFPDVSYPRAVGAEREPFRQWSVDSTSSGGEQNDAARKKSSGLLFQNDLGCLFGSGSIPSSPVVSSGMCISGQQSRDTVHSVVGTVMEEDMAVDDLSSSDKENDNSRPVSSTAAASLQNVLTGSAPIAIPPVPGLSDQSSMHNQMNYLGTSSPTKLNYNSLDSGGKVSQVHFSSESFGQSLFGPLMSPPNVIFGQEPTSNFDDGKATKTVANFEEMRKVQEELRNQQIRARTLMDNLEKATIACEMWKKQADAQIKATERSEMEKGLLKKQLEEAAGCINKLQTELSKYSPISSLVALMSNETTNPKQLEMARDQLRAILEHVDQKIQFSRVVAQSPICARCGRQTGTGSQASGGGQHCPICSPGTSPGKAGGGIF